MKAVDKIVFSKGEEGDFIMRLFGGEDFVRYSIVDAQDVKDIIYMMPQCLKADLEGKNLEFDGRVCDVECDNGCTAMQKLSPAQTTAILRVLYEGDNPSDLDAMVQAIQVCLQGHAIEEDDD